MSEDVLSGTGKGGILSDGYLEERPLESYLGEEEIPVFVCKNAKHGVERHHEDRDDSERIRPGDGYRAFALATDSRLLFVIGDSDTTDGDRTISIPLADVELVDHSSGVLAGELVVVTSADVRWSFACRGNVADVVEYLEAASMAWMNVESRLDDARKHLVDATQRLESKAYGDAMDAVRDAMAATDAARRREREFCEGGVHAMSDRIEKTKQRIRDVRLDVLRGRATHHIDAGERHWRAERYDEAYEAYSDAHDDYLEILSVREPTFEESEGLRDRLARVERNMTYLEQAPIDRAERAHERAADAETPAERAEALERALDQYRSALALDWGRDLKRFECDTDEIRERVDALAREVIDARQTEAARHVEAANDHYDAGRYADARERYLDGREALRAMLDVARELVPDAADDVTDRIDAIEDRIEVIDGRLDGESDAPSDGETGAEKPSPEPTGTPPSRDAADDSDAAPTSSENVVESP
ncbi:MAG: hypothetical protein ABEJ85_04335 [Haloarculaceae archaeon]